LQHQVREIKEWQALILLGYFIGARLSDCVQMKWENIQPEQGSRAGTHGNGSSLFGSCCEHEPPRSNLVSE
jgi:integrase